MSTYGTQDFSFITQDDDDTAGMPPVFQGQSAVRGSAVHGRGMWQNFLRSFANPLYALLDLFDNAVDASWYLPKDTELPKIKVDVDTIGQGGIYIRNAASDPIPKMKQILEVFRSAKVNQASAIGENGVGIKHACANLSDLSLVLTKTSDAYSLGILMKDLQQDVPNFPHLVISKSASVYGRIKAMCEQEQKTWGKAMEVYGDGDMCDGINRIENHFKEMNMGRDWKDATDVFTIIISKLRQTGHSENKGEDPDNLDLHDNDGDPRSKDLLNEFANKLPQLYIHLSDKIQVQVCNKVIDMSYWETRLADLTRFEVGIPQGPEKDPNLKLDHAEPPYAHQTVRFWLGFNVYRPSASAHIYYYSRQSGRLIKSLGDCRSLLKLQAGSTDFKQGLTIILDDYNSTLPLNPTKQDLSFAFQEHGETHKTNLIFWLSGITQFFWKYHFERTAKSSKKTLTSAVTKAAKLFDNAIALKGVRPLNEMEPIRFQNVTWSQKRVKAEDEDGQDASYMKLLAVAPARNSAQLLVGQDTLVRLSEVDLGNSGRRNEKKRLRSSTEESTSNTKKAKVNYYTDDGESDKASDAELDKASEALPRKQKATARKSVKALARRQELYDKEMLKAKEKEIKILQKEKENAEKQNAELRKALEAAKKENGVTARERVDNYLINIRIMNRETGRSADIRVPAEANRSIQRVLQDKKLKGKKLLNFRNDQIQKLKRKEAVFKVGIWDPSKAEDDYSCIYDTNEMKTETTLELFNFLSRDGMNLFRQKYDPVHLCIFVKDDATQNEEEGEYLF